MRQELIQHQTTKLVMTTELRQAISLLQYSSTELNEFLQEQAVENPLLDVDSISSNPTNITDYSYPNSKSQASSDEKQQMLLNIEDPTKESLHDHLLTQVTFMKLSAPEQEIIEYLIFSIDENGYLNASLLDIAEQVITQESVVEKLLYKLQQCEPAGIGARNLQECLLIQLKRLPQRFELAEAVVANHLNELAERKWKGISRKLAVSIPAIQEVFDFIQELNPRPGSMFYHHQDSQYIIPDMTIKEVNGELKLSMNEKLIPTIRLEQQYERNLQKSSEIYSYLKTYVDQFHFIKKAIEQRFKTMEKVMSEILEIQRDFFKKGKAFLKPLTLKDIATRIDMHESTISRTVNGKYVQTPQGVFELKYFFTSSIQTNDTEASSAAVKEAIREIVDQENKQKPLSDQKIAHILKEDYQFNVSRRTVAKYRDQLGILSSSGRKRY